MEETNQGSGSMSYTNTQAESNDRCGRQKFRNVLLQSQYRSCKIQILLLGKTASVDYSFIMEHFQKGFNFYLLQI